MAKNFYGNRGNMGGMGGGMNMQAAIKQAQKMQEDMQKMQASLSEQEFSASAGGGMVTARVNGNHQVLGLEINPAAVDPEDVEMLQDMVVAAVNAAFTAAQESADRQMKQITGNLNIPGGLF